MILLTRLNDAPMWISSDQIETIESTPDSVLVMLSGRKVIVKESPEEIVAKIVAFRRLVHSHPEVLVDNPGKENNVRNANGD